MNFSIDKQNRKWYNILSSSFLNLILHRAETTAPFDPCPFAIATTHANDEQQSFTKGEKNKNHPNKTKQRKYGKNEEYGNAGDKEYAHELLHVYGAEDFYYNDIISKLAEKFGTVN